MKTIINIRPLNIIYSDFITFINSKSIPNTKVTIGNNVVIESDTELSNLHKLYIENYVINSNNGNSQTIKIKELIFSEIYDSCIDDAQLHRILSVMDSKYTLSIALSAFNYSLARHIIGKVLLSGDIVQADYDMIDSIIPEVI